MMISQIVRFVGYKIVF